MRTGFRLLGFATDFYEAKIATVRTCRGGLGPQKGNSYESTPVFQVLLLLVSGSGFFDQFT